MTINNFVLDSFQQQAIDYLEKNYSVIVAAPTGAGKTVIAEHVIEKCLNESKGIIYTAPIKALSNQKFRDFSSKFPKDVGIITGDIKLNPEADVLIMTTEIFRNYLLQDAEKLNNKHWVIFDEIHYLDDIERGTVWEESIIFLPAHMKMLALSATLPNIDELIAWMSKIHKHTIKKIEENTRPVPLHFYFQANNRIFSDIKELKNCILTNNSFFRVNRINNLIGHLKEKSFLPCIYFCFSRQKCENLATELTRYDFLNMDEKNKISELYHSYAKKFKIQDHSSTASMFTLLRRGISYHHAGLLPPLKEIIERLFTEKLIKVIFTTETFALGINMPSRTVCFDEISKYARGRLRYLRVRDFYQMAGRAGRRGIDKEGYVFSRLKPYKEDVEAISNIMYGKPEEIRSQFNASYATILNLYRDIQDDLLSVYFKTFHHFQSGNKIAYEKKLLQSKLKLLKQLLYIKDNSLSIKGNFASNIFGYELIITELMEKEFFENINWVELGVIICAIVTEIRYREPIPHLNKKIRKLRMTLDAATSRIQKLEKRSSIFPQSKTAHFQLANSMQRWLEGENFEQIIKLTSSDEGEIIRNFRMTIQVLRDMNQKYISHDLRGKIHRTIDALNRDIVNAQWQIKI